jgi:hypothetical protein
MAGSNMPRAKRPNPKQEKITKVPVIVIIQP